MAAEKNTESVLLADDDASDLEFLSALLRKDGFALETATSGIRACELLESRRFDLVITDLVMPGSTGFDVLRTARKTHPEAICIALTSFGSLDSAMDALNLGAYSYLLKPLEEANFRHVLKRGLEKQRLTKELRLRNEELSRLNQQLDAKVQDATRELRQLNERILNEMASLKELDELKTEFLNNVSHDLRNPVTTIHGYLSCLLDEPQRFQADQLSCLLKTRKAAEHMEYLISQLLEAARLRSGKIKLNRQAVKVPEILEEALSLLRPQAEAGGVRLECKAPKPFTLSADRGRLLQILSNLLGNACKFTPKGGQVELAASKDAKSVRFSISDTGPGIAQEHHARIFEKFYQVDTSLSKSFRGLGLGLRIAKDLVDLHQGRIWVESEAGKGSTFFVELPLEGA